METIEAVRDKVKTLKAFFVAQSADTYAVEEEQGDLASFVASLSLFKHNSISDRNGEKMKTHLFHHKTKKQ